MSTTTTDRIHSKLLTGNTYPVKDELKALGSKWDKAQKGWMVPIDKWDEAMEIMDNAPISTPRPQFKSRYNKYRSHYVRLNSGAELYRNNNGRCEDAPCCGCCNY